MSAPWKQRKGETPKAYTAFMAYVALGPKRSLRKLSEAEGYNLRQLERWSSQHDWQTRSGAHDVAELTRAMEGREREQHRLRQRVIDQADKALDVMFRLLDGKMPRSGDKLEQRSRDGERVTHIPVVKPSTLLALCQDILDRAGIVKPRRVELTGADGEALELQARSELSNLSTEAVSSIRELLRASKDAQ